MSLRIFTGCVYSMTIAFTTIGSRVEAAGQEPTRGDALTTTPDDPDVRARARAAFERGARAYETGHWSQAHRHFAEAERLFHAPTNLFYIGQAQERLGRLVQARDAYRKVLAERLGTDAPQPFRDAQQEARQALVNLEQRLPRVEIGVRNGAATSVKVDQETWPVAPGQAVPVNPGVHRLQAFGKWMQSRPLEVRVAEGQTVSVELELEPVEPAAPHATPKAPADQPGFGSKLPVYAAFGVGGASLGVSLGLFLAARHQDNSADRLFARCEPAPEQQGLFECGQPRQAEIESLDRDAARLRTFAGVTLGLGVAGLAAGSLLLFLDQSRQTEREDLATVQPWLGARQLGVAGRF